MIITPLYPREIFLGDGGSLLTLGLFYEHRHQTPNQNAVYTLRDTDWKGFKSMYLIYMDEDSEYEAAMKLLGSWPHWKKLCECTWFKPYLKNWRTEREIKEAVIGKKTIIEAAKEGNVAAAKELVNQALKAKTVGRPTKHAKELQDYKLKAIDQKVVSLLDRIPRV